MLNPTKYNRAALEAKLHLMHQTRKNIPFTKSEVAGIRAGEFVHSTAMITRMQANDMVRQARIRWRKHVKDVGLFTALVSKRHKN